jgi:hypothetical protein
VQDVKTGTGVAAARADRRGPALSLLIGTAVYAVALSLSRPAPAATYKWVDEKGVVHYADRLPAEDVNKGTVELNRQGVQVKKTDPALTPEQRRAQAEEEQRRVHQAREQQEQERRDRALLSSYTSESEIELARKRSLQAIDGTMKSAQAYTEQLTRRKQELDTKIKNEYREKPVPVVLERELAGITTELGRQADLIALKKREIAQVNAKYDADKERWRALIAAQGAEPATSAKLLPEASNAAEPYPTFGNSPARSTATRKR